MNRSGYRCIYCGSPDAREESNGLGTWYWIKTTPENVGGIGPFCSVPHTTAFRAMSLKEQAAALIGPAYAQKMVDLRERYAAEAGA